MIPTTTDWIQAISTIVVAAFTIALVIATIVYVKRTSDIASATREQAKATKEQAEASVQMAGEMREQMEMASRPWIIQKPVPSSGIMAEGIKSDGFKIYNEGSGPAINLEILLLSNKKSLLEERKEPFLRAGESPIEFRPFALINQANSTCYVLCRYQGVLSGEAKPIWYQTCLPFKPVKSQRGDNIIIQPGELKFTKVFQKKLY